MCIRDRSSPLSSSPLSSSSLLDTTLVAIGSSTPKPNLKSRLLKRRPSTDADTTSTTTTTDSTRRVGITISPNIKSSSIDDHNANVINDVKVPSSKLLLPLLLLILLILLLLILILLPLILILPVEMEEARSTQ